MEKRFILYLLVLVIFFSLELFAGAPGRDIKITNFGTKKPVIFSHQRHRNRGVKCGTCHHKIIRKCSDCHKDIKAMKKVSHKKCKGCHKKMGGPTKCNSCHR